MHVSFNDFLLLFLSFVKSSTSLHPFLCSFGSFLTSLPLRRRLRNEERVEDVRSGCEERAEVKLVMGCVVGSLRLLQDMKNTYEIPASYNLPL